MESEVPMNEKTKQRGWLALTIDEGTEVHIGEEITIQVGKRNRSGRVVQIRIRAPRELKIMREKIDQGVGV
jgi:sRNA-binding carbon storage regulator CsrA